MIEPIRAEPPDLTRPRVLRQTWAELAYFHWPYEPDLVQRLLPESVRVDTFDGVAWVGLIPFTMRDVRIGPTPPVPYLGTFVEINVRTYVVDPAGRRAVWFFSLDVPRAVIVAVARTVFALPYCWSTTDYHATARERHYSLVRRRPHGRRASVGIDFTIGEPMAAVSELDHFLTARWALLTRRFGRLRYGRVHHPQWPLHTVQDHFITGDVIEAAGLPAPTGEPRTAYSPSVDVGVSWLEKVPSVDT